MGLAVLFILMIVCLLAWLLTRKQDPPPSKIHSFQSSIEPIRIKPPDPNRPSYLPEKNPTIQPSQIRPNSDMQNSGNRFHGDRDAWEGSFWEANNPFPVETSLHIQYRDGNGARTERIVDVREFDPDLNGGMLIGHCRLRNETRTFRVDRILQCVDIETGEVVENLPQYLRDEYEASPHHTRDKLLEDEYDVLRILLFVGKADGAMRSAEKKIIRDFCVTTSGDTRITDEMIDRMLAQMDVPSLHAFKIAVGRVAKQTPEFRDRLYETAVQMVRTQKTVHPSEQEALDYLRKRFTA